MDSGFDKSVRPDEIKKAKKYVIETAPRYGKRIRVEIRSVMDTTYHYELGVRDFVLGTGLHTLKDFYKDEGDQLKGTIMD